MMNYLIAPSILSADLANLAHEVKSVMDAGADMIHFDVMDNHYVPNLTFGPVICQSLRNHFPKLTLDVHLMTNPVDDLIHQFANAGANRLSIHPDATIHLERSLALIQSYGCEAGIVLNPATSIDCLTWIAHRLDFILVMTVNPGFGGQSLITSVLDKIKLIHQRYPHIPICVDGGVDEKNIYQIGLLGASQFVAGSAIFKSNDYSATIERMRSELAKLSNQTSTDKR
jgi:ribulose-phosphate 3-epimerase